MRYRLEMGFGDEPKAFTACGHIDNMAGIVKVIGVLQTEMRYAIFQMYGEPDFDLATTRINIEFTA